MYGVLVFGILSIIAVHPKEIHHHNNPVHYPLNVESSPQNFRESRQLKDVWNTIKNSAKKLWNSIRMVVLNTKEKINTWLQNAKTKAKHAVEHLKEKVNQLREKSKNLINEIVGTGQIVKECIKKDSANVEQILKQIIKDVSECISNSLKHVSHLLETKTAIATTNNFMEAEHVYEINDINGTKFITEIEISLNKCLEQTDSEECMHVVKKEFFGKMENMESDVLNHRTESRSKVDDLLESIMTCSVDGLLGASNVIAAETVQVIACVMEEKNGSNKKGSEKIAT